MLFTKQHTLFLSVAALLYGCSGHTLQDMVDGSNQDAPRTVAPSQNSALQSISPSVTASDAHKEHRIMEKDTNEWIKNEWEPLTEGNTAVTKTGEDNNTDTEGVTISNVEQPQSDDNSSTGLQYYVDKAGVYLENKKKRDANVTKEPSHVDKVNAMPGIGKIDRR